MFESIDWNEQYGLQPFFLAFIFLCLPITRSGGDEKQIGCLSSGDASNPKPLQLLSENSVKYFHVRLMSSMSSVQLLIFCNTLGMPLRCFSQIVLQLHQWVY